ncbi:hypothetical protein J6590_094901, partial [Homalodisca vitripennis]
MPTDSAANLLPPEQQDYYRALIRQTLEKSNRPKSNLTFTEISALKSLRNDESIVILPADK